MHIRELRALFVRLTGFFRKEQRERELDLELESHLQMHIEDNLRAGMSEEEARRRAVVKLGGIEPTKEKYRRQSRLPVVEMLAQDLRYGLRRLRATPVFTLIAITSLALGIGANTAIFSLVNTTLLRPLPIEKPGELLSLSNVQETHASPTFSYPNYKEMRERSKDIFSGLIAYRFAPLSLSHDGVSERLWGYLVTGNYFDVLGVSPAMGRLISTDDDRTPGAHPVTVLSFQCWQQRFGADPNIVGKSLIANGRSYTVIGVAPQGFYGTEIIAAPELWFPMMMQGEIEAGNNWLERRGAEYIFMQGRLKAGVTESQAKSALDAIALQLAEEYPTFNAGKRVMLTPAGLLGVMRAPVIGFTGLLMLIVAFVLLLACTNLANLLLARATERRKEIAVRLALGAGRLRLVGQLLAECMLLSIMSGICGLLLAYWLISLAANVKPPVDVPLFIDLHIDYRVLIFTCLISLFTGIVFGLLPALQATKVDLLPALKDETSGGSYRRSRLKSSLIILQVALSLILLVGGGLMMRALARAQALNLGFNPQRAVEASFDLRLQGYDKGRGLEFQRRLLERVRGLSGVQAAGISDLVPVDLHFARDSVFIEGQEVERAANVPRAMTSRISPGYLQAMSTRLIAGRDFTEQDDERAQPVAIVNEEFARRFWPGQNPLGKRFSEGNADAPLMQLVGVIEDGKYAGLNETPQPYVCRPLWQSYTGTSTLVARTNGDQQKLLAAIRSEVQQLDPHLPLASAKPLAERMDLPLLPARVAASLLGSFGLLALALAAIGIYGVMSYSVSRRTHEIGIRMALGAQNFDVLRLVVGQGMMLVLVGVGLGLFAALLLASLMKSVLFGVSAADPLTYVGLTALLTTVALLACYLPARRATKIDPLVALRNE